MLLKLAKYKVVFVVIFTLMLGLIAVPASAALNTACTDSASCCTETELADGTCNEVCVNLVCREDTFGAGDVDRGGLALGNEDFRTTIVRIINVALSLLGIIAVVIILAGGFKWMTAGGNEEKTTEARKLIFAGIIGLAIILAAWAIANFVIENLGRATGAEGYVPVE